MVKIKRLITSFVLVGLVMSFFTPDNFVSAKEVDGKCSITIDANVHDGNRHAEPTGDCKGDLFGWVDPTGTPMIAGAVTREVANGQVIRVSVGAGLYDLSITVIPKKEEPKPEPNPEPKPEPKPTPQPNPVKPKEPSNPSPSKPKTNDGNSGNNDSKGSSNNKNSGNTGNSGGSSKGNNNDSNVKSNDNKNSSSKGHDKRKDVKEVNSEKDKEKLTIAELRDKGVAVKKENGKYYAIYEDENGNEMKKEISEKEYERLKEDAEEVENETIIANKNHSDSEGRKLPNTATKTFTVLLLGAVILVVGGGVFYYNHRKAKSVDR